MPSKRSKGSGKPGKSAGPARPAVNVARALLEAFETLEEEFDEAGEHVRQRREFGSLRLSPVRPIAADRLEAGSLGWLREIRLSADSGRGGPSDEMEELAGWLYFVVKPGRGEAPATGAAESPILGIPVEQFAYAEECRRVPRSFFAVKSDLPATVPLLRRFAEQVRAELETEG
ncbi:MAG: hypothetical protein ACREC5_04445 [Thermoplasmata archaeon]